HPPQRPSAALRIVAPFHHFADDNVGVVVSLLGMVLELTGTVKNGRDGRDGETAEQGELQGASGVEREGGAGTEQDDTLMIGDRIEGLDLVEDAHGIGAGISFAESL